MEDEVEQQALIQEIGEAFRGVTRKGGISWRDSMVADRHGDETSVDYVDRDLRWQELVGDPEWRPNSGFGGFAFLDPVGARYYLPACLMRALSGEEWDFLEFHLTGGNPKHPEERDRRWSKWSLLTEPQRQCVRRFLKLMIRRAGVQQDQTSVRTLTRALESHWRE